MVTMLYHNGMSNLEIISFNLDSAVRNTKKIKILPSSPRYFMKVLALKY